MSSPLEQKIVDAFGNISRLFVDALLHMFPNDTHLGVLKILMDINQISYKPVVLTVTKNLLPYKDMVQKRNEDFFLGNAEIFNFASVEGDEDKVIHFKELWASPSLQGHNRQTLWLWFDKFVDVCSAYKKHFPENLVAPTTVQN